MSASYVPAAGCRYIILSGIPPNPNRLLLLLRGFTGQTTNGQIELSGNSTGSRAVPVGALVYGDGTYELTSDYDGTLWARFYSYTMKQWGSWTSQPGSAWNAPSGF